MALWVSHQKATRFLVVLPFPSPIGFFVSAGHRIAGEEGISADHALATSRCDSAGSGRVDGLARLVGRRLGVRRASLGPVRIFRPRPCRAPSATVGRLRGSYRASLMAHGWMVELDVERQARCSFLHPRYQNQLG
jgi:hypothetical protein